MISVTIPAMTKKMLTRGKEIHKEDFLSEYNASKREARPFYGYPQQKQSSRIKCQLV